MDHQNRQKQVKDVLDQQIKLRTELRERKVKERQEFDKRILDAAKKEMEVEAKQKKDLHKKVIEQKRMRDVMLKEAKDKQHPDLVDRQNEEKARVMKLTMEIEKEKESKARKKQVEREAAMKVI